MHVIDQPQPAATPIPGIHHATWAGRDQGLHGLSLWHQAMAPGAATPPHAHDCDEVVLCIEGHGELDVGGTCHAFGPAQTLVLPAGVPHRIVNTGAQPLRLTAVFSASPVPVRLPDGSALELPWRS